MKYAILMPHGADLLRCLERVRSAQNTEESTPCTLSTKIEPDSRGLVPGIHVLRPHRQAQKAWMAGINPAMTIDCCRDKARPCHSLSLLSLRPTSPTCR